MKRAGLVVAAVLLVTGVAQADNSYEACFRARTNGERVMRHILPLRIDARIDKIARDHSDRMRDAGTIFHNEELGDDYNRYAGGYEEGGENVGMGGDCDGVFDAFMASPGHKANILDKAYDYIGVGVTWDSASQTLYVTLDFFTPKNAPVKPKPAKPPPEPRCTCSR